MLSAIAIGIGWRRARKPTTFSRSLARCWTPRRLMRKRHCFRSRARRKTLRCARRPPVFGCDIVFLDESEFSARQPEFLARGAKASVVAKEKTGFASVAEAAALMGGGPNAILIAPRRAKNNVTCALAAPADELKT